MGCSSRNTPVIPTPEQIRDGYRNACGQWIQGTGYLSSRELNYISNLQNPTYSTVAMKGLTEVAVTEQKTIVNAIGVSNPQLANSLANQLQLENVGIQTATSQSTTQAGVSSFTPRIPPFLLLVGGYFLLRGFK